MDNLIIIRDKFSNIPFNHKMAANIGVSKNIIHRLLYEGSIERIYRGIYTLPDTEFNQEFYFRCATLSVGGESYISTISAYIYYELSDLVGRKVWVSVPVNCRRNAAWLKTIRIRNFYPDAGILKKQGFCISNIERTLVEGFRYHKQIGLRQAAEAYKTAMLKKITSPVSVYEMAEKLNIGKSIKPFIETL